LTSPPVRGGASADPGGAAEIRALTRAHATPGGGTPVRAVPDPVSSDVLLSEIAQLLLSENAPDRVFEAVADALADLVPHDMLSLYQADNPLRVLRPVLVRDAYAPEIMALGPISYGSGLAGRAAEMRTPLLMNDAQNDPRAKRVPGTPDRPESFIAVPLVARDELVGVLCLTRLGEDHTYSQEEFRLVQSFAGMASLAIDNARIRARLEAEVVTDHLTALHNHRYFHERLSTELRKANMRHGRMALLILDIDDFARLNDGYGHVAGDAILQGVASVVRQICRDEDVVCRIGGEEFGIVMPGFGLEEAMEVADTIRAAIADVDFPEAGRVTVSAGLVEGPLHASSPRDLTARAYGALRQAKLEGKNRVRGGGALSAPTRSGGTTPRPATVGGRGGDDAPMGETASGELRSVAHLKMLQSLSNKLNRLTEVGRIGETITAELRSLVDYHNCRVHVLSENGRMLIPVAFRGELSEYQGETFDALLTKVGEGLTGHVAQTGVSIYTPNADECEFAVTIPGTTDIDESMLCVPLMYGDRVIGTVTLSKLGLDQFDQDDLRVLEVLASTAAIAIENARLFGQVRESAEISQALLELSTAVTNVSEDAEIFRQALTAVPALLGCSTVGIWVRDPETGDLRLAAHHGFDAQYHDRVSTQAMNSETAVDYLLSIEEPFVLPKDVVVGVPSELFLTAMESDLLVAPMRWDPEGLGAFIIIPPEDDHKFSDRDLRLARGIADITSLALANAGHYGELERAYLSTIEALANALEAKDEYTSDHARALAEMTIAVGEEMGLADLRLKWLEMGALFHDIGKIGVPSEIIRKPAPLTAPERTLMNLHPEIGAEILAPVPFLQPIRPIVRACHERWDGGGYPDGLQGDGIPLEARIIFVCDAYHAMTTDRPYRAALTEDEAVRRLELASGTQFDPHVVEAFVRLHARGDIHYTERHR
jgi:diguanylate cyclase (GGDEF)-like protein